MALNKREFFCRFHPLSDEKTVFITTEVAGAANHGSTAASHFLKCEFFDVSQMPPYLDKLHTNGKYLHSLSFANSQNGNTLARREPTPQSPHSLPL